jgi:hypothetical protein
MPYPTELGVTGDYYAQIFISFPGGRSEKTFPFESFLVVDDRTLILMAPDKYYKMTRLTYIDEASHVPGAP